ncbi:MAG: biopolymer transporter ExbD [Leptospirales bacterium]
MSQYPFKRKRAFRKTTEATVDSSAIGDMAFLLLIFFIVTSSFLIKQGFFLSLPSKDGGAIKVEEEKLFEIEPTDEAYVYESRTINEKKLRLFIEQKQETTEELILIIYMNPDVKYSRLIDTLSIARDFGIMKISIKDTEEKS